MGVSDLTVFAAFAAILAVLLIGGTLIAAPIRRKMVVLANDLYDAPGSDDRLRRRLDFLLDTATSPFIAVLLIFASVSTLIDAIFFNANPEPTPAYQDDRRFQKLINLYLASVGLANPIVTILFLPFAGLLGFLHSFVTTIRGAHVAAAQVERVAHSRLSRA